MPKGSVTAALCLAIMPCLAGSLDADIVVLENGEVFDGKILRIDRNEVSIQLKRGGTLSFRRSQVVRARKTDKDEDETIGAPAKEEEEDIPLAPPAGDAPAAKEAAPGKRSSPARAAAATGATGAGPGPSRAKPGSVLSGTVLADAANGLQLTVPAGFLPWPEARIAPVLHAYRDPVTEATLTISAFAVNEPILKVKEAAAQSYARTFDRFNLKRDEELKGLPHKAWVLELTSWIGGVEVHQTQLFTGTEKQAVMVSYSTAAAVYPRYKDAFTASMETFRFVGTESSKTDAPPAGPPPAPEVPQAKKG
jgi:hypothetical protein